jgi:hypothetical protein
MGLSTQKACSTAGLLCSIHSLKRLTSRQRFLCLSSSRRQVLRSAKGHLSKGGGGGEGRGSFKHSIEPGEPAEIPTKGWSDVGWSVDIYGGDGALQRSHAYIPMIPTPSITTSRSVPSLPGTNV